MFPVFLALRGKKLCGQRERNERVYLNDGLLEQQKFECLEIATTEW